jgi:hypothetical protein
MATYQTMADIAANPTFKSRVEYCMKKAAVAIMAEDAATANHAERVTYSVKILDGTASVAEYAKAVVTNPTLTANGDIGASPLHGISDGDLEFTVNSMMNAMAGIATA